MALRLVKLSSEVFKDYKEVRDFFFTNNDENNVCHPNRNGRFNFNKQIAEDGLNIGDHLIFSYSGKPRIYALADSGVLENTDEYSGELPRCFYIDLNSLKRITRVVSLTELGNTVNLNLNNQGWNRIDEEDIIKEMLSILGIQ